MSLIRRGIIAIEVLLRSLGPRRVDLAGIEAFALLGIAEQIVGPRDLLEFLLGRLVTGIEIRMQLFRQLPVGLLDIGRRRRRGNAENLVRISHDPLRRNVGSPGVMRAQNKGICNTISHAAVRSRPSVEKQS